MKVSAALFLLMVSLVAIGQMASSCSGAGVTLDWGSHNTVANTSGEIDKDAAVEGVLVINDDVYIDGVKIDRGVSEYASRKTKKTYSIRWGKKGEGASVTEKD